MIYRNFLRLILFVSLSFAAMEGFAGDNIQSLYERVLKSNYEKIAPLKAYAKKRQTTYIFSAALGLLVFVLFVKYFKATGAIVALLMIAGGIWYLKTETPAISPYKEKFSEYIISPIAEDCCGFRYMPGKITQHEIEESKIFSPRIRHFSAKEGLYVKKGVRIGFVDIDFDTKENASVERFSENSFSGFVIVCDGSGVNGSGGEAGALVTENFKKRVAHLDLDFSLFFADMPRSGTRGGFETFGKVTQEQMDRWGDIADAEIAVSFLRDKTVLFLYQKRDPLDPGVYVHFDLQAARGYAKVFERIDTLVRKCL